MNWKYVFVLPLVTAAMIPGVAFGNVICDVSLNTAPLMANPAGPFSVDFQFNDGSGLGDGNNTVIVDNFNFGSGGPVGSASIFGSVSGDLASGITLTDSGFFNDFNQQFTPGAVLRFTVNLTTNLDSINVPDEFSFAILDSSGAGNAMLIADINSSSPSLLGYSSDALSLAAPAITAVPEPSSGWLAAGACGLFAALRARSASAARRSRAGG